MATDWNQQLVDAVDGNNLRKFVEAMEHGVSDDAKNKALYNAVEQGRNGFVLSLLEAGASPQDSSHEGSLLIAAVRHKHFDIAKQMLDLGVDPNIQDPNNKLTAMHYVACYSNQRDLLKDLLKADADPNIQDDEGRTALFEAAQSGNQEIIATLLAAGADPNILAKGDYYFPRGTALHAAASGGQTEAVRYLLAGGADVTLLDAQQKTPLEVTAGKHMAIKRLLKNAEKGKRPSPAELGFQKVRDELERHVPQALEPAESEEPALAFQALTAAQTAPEPAALPIIGEHTRRFVESYTVLRVEHESMENMLQSVISDKFIGELVYREAIGAEQLHLLEGAGVKIERQYGHGPEPKWNVELWAGEGQPELHPTVNAMGNALDRAMGKQHVMGIGYVDRKGKATLSSNDVEQVVEAFNTLLSDPIGKIDMNELRAAAKTEAQAKQQQQKQDLGRA